MTKLYEANNHILIHAGYDNPTKHSHMAAHIIISTGDELRITSNGTEHRCHGVMVPSGVSHMVDTCGNATLVFLYDCTTDVARQIKDIHSISKESCQKITDVYATLERAYTTENYYRFEKSVLTQLRFAGTSFCVKDERIMSAMEYIRSMSSEKLSFTHLCTTEARKN